MKPRFNFYLDEDLAERLDALTRRSGSSKSAIISAALRAYLERGASDIDAAVQQRLDRHTRLLGAVQREQQILIESFAHFLRYYLTVTPPLAEADQPAAKALGQDRFSVFIDQVARRIAQGRSVARELVERLSPVETPT